MNMSKRSLYFDQATTMYIAGATLKEISKVIPVSTRTLQEWSKIGYWKVARKRADYQKSIIKAEDIKKANTIFKSKLPHIVSIIAK